MKVLVTGATSLVGRVTVRRLVDRGDQVTTLQRGTTDRPGRAIRGSLTDPDAVERACAGQEAVIHLAARVGAAGPWADFERVNVTGTAGLLAAARRAGAGAFVHVSSPSVAHPGRSLVGAGADPANPATARGAYARSKALGELAAVAASSPAMPVVVIRPHLIWGPGDTQLVGRVVDRARRGRLALVGPGTALVDTLYVDNAADALVAALDQAPRLGERVFVLSNGQPRTAAELTARVLAAAGLTMPPRHVPRWLAVAGGSLVEQVWARTGRTDDPPMTRFLAEQLATAHWFRQDRARTALRWAPAVTLEEGFIRLADWFRGGSADPATTVESWTR